MLSWGHPGPFRSPPTSLTVPMKLSTDASNTYPSPPQDMRTIIHYIAERFSRFTDLNPSYGSNCEMPLSLASRTRGVPFRGGGRRFWL